MHSRRKTNTTFFVYYGMCKVAMHAGWLFGSSICRQFGTANGFILIACERTKQNIYIYMHSRHGGGHWRLTLGGSWIDPPAIDDDDGICAELNWDWQGPAQA